MLGMPTRPIFYTSTDFTLALPEGHRFPAEKYNMLHDRLVGEGILEPGQLIASPKADDEDILSAHSSEYVFALREGTIDPKIMRRIGFPWSGHIHLRGQRTVGGALAAARTALQTGISGQLAGGTHHAHRDFGAGFCIYNDFAVVALRLLAERRVERIAIIDLDVHQGDGNASILADHPDIFILDVHGERNFPFRKVPSTLDVPLPDECTDDGFLEALSRHLPEVFSFAPDLILYQAGVDGLKTDRLGRLSLTFRGLIERDRRVLSACRDRGIPCSMAIGGGYADPIDDTVIAYANTYQVAKDLYGF